MNFTDCKKGFSTYFPVESVENYPFFLYFCTVSVENFVENVKKGSMKGFSSVERRLRLQAVPAFKNSLLCRKKYNGR